MHEASIAQYIIDSIEERLQSGEIAGVIRKVCLQVGRLTAVVPDNLQFLFGVLVEGSALKGSALEIELIPLKVRCLDCGRETTLDEMCFFCSHCSSPQLEVLSGRELMINAVEVE